jgi:hypothetical protein
MSRWSWLGDARAMERRRTDLWRRLGPRPARAAVSGERLERLGRTIEHWQLLLNSEQPVPALLVRPREGIPLRGVVLYCHAHGNRFDIGKDELLLGRPALQAPPYGRVLGEHGWAALAIDHWGFGERGQPSERMLVKRLLWQGQTLWGWRLHDTLAAVEMTVDARPPRPTATCCIDSTRARMQRRCSLRWTRMAPGRSHTSRSASYCRPARSAAWRSRRRRRQRWWRAERNRCLVGRGSATRAPWSAAAPISGGASARARHVLP